MPSKKSDKASSQQVLCVLVGAGPGDVELLTLKALYYLQLADVLLYDNLIPEAVLVYCKSSCKKIYVGKRSGNHSYTQSDINTLLVKECKKVKNSKNHRIIVRLKGGDPFIFGQGYDEVISLRQQGIPFEVVPGISSALSVPLYAGIPLTERTISSSFFVGTGHEAIQSTDATTIEPLKTEADTRVYLMSIKHLSQLVNKHLEAGFANNTPIAVIQQGTTGNQKTIVSTLSALLSDLQANKIALTTPGLVVIGKVVSLRQKNNWYENLALFGKKIALTRSLKDSFSLYLKLRRLGALVVEMPAVTTVRLKARQSWFNILLPKSEGNIFLCFSSKRGVEIFFAELIDRKLDARLLSRWKIISVGNETTNALAKYHLTADFTAKNHRHLSGEQALIRLITKIHQQQKIDFIVLPRALKEKSSLQKKLSQQKIVHEVLPLYTTKALKIERKFLSSSYLKTLDGICFTSSSAANSFLSQAAKSLSERSQQQSKSPVLFSIGTTTQKSIDKYNLTLPVPLPVATAITPTYEALTEIMTQSFDKNF